MDKKLQLTIDDVTRFHPDDYTIPIPRQALEQAFSLDKQFAWDVLEDAKNEWKGQLYDYVYNLPVGQKRAELESVYFNPPTAEERKFNKNRTPKENMHRKNHPGEIIEPTWWNFDVQPSEKYDNGFAHALSIGQEFGTLYYNSNVIRPFSKERIAPEKLQLLNNQNPEEHLYVGHVVLPVYSQRNSKDTGTTLFLRSWGVNYINKILEHLQE